MTNANANINKHELHANLVTFRYKKMFMAFVFMSNDINPIHCPYKYKNPMLSNNVFQYYEI